MNEISETARSASRSATIWGVIVMFLGLVAMGAPFAAGIAVTMTIGIVLIATGIAQGIYAAGSETFGSGVLRFLFSVLAVLAGLSLAAQPGAGLATITLFLAAWFFVDGVWSVIAGFRWKPGNGWGWMVFSGIVSVVLGVMIYRQFPVSALWLVGVLVGIRLVFAGLTMIMLGSVPRRAVTVGDS